MTTKPIEIAILGAGIAGVTMAIALASSPRFHITLYEQRPGYSEIGAGVGFGPNALRAIDLISPSISAVVARVKTENKDPAKRHLWYDYRWGHDVGEYKGGDKIAEIATAKGNVHGNMSRKAFMDGLIDLIPDGVTAHFNKKTIDVVESESRIEIVFADGSKAHADAVIGCDGIRSNARKALLGNVEAATARYTGKYAYRKVVPMDKAIAAVGTEVENRQMYLGQGGHILTGPIRNGDLLNIVAFSTDSNGEHWRDRQWVIPSTRKALLKDFEGWHGNARKILELIEEPEKWALFEHPPCSTYTHSKMPFCILGDAAHATTPHLGAGAGFAIEDAYILSALLYSLGPDQLDSASLHKVMKAYDEVRRPRSQELVVRSRATGQVFDLTPEEGTVVEDWGAKVETVVGQNADWVWNVDLAEMLRIAKMKLKG